MTAGAGVFGNCIAEATMSTWGPSILHDPRRSPHMELFDTHAHLADEHLAADLDGVVERAAAAGVTSILAVGTTLETSRRCCQLASQFGGLWASTGIHPNHAAEAQPSDWDEIVGLSKEPKVVALGETGLDL